MTLRHVVFVLLAGEVGGRGHDQRNRSVCNLGIGHFSGVAVEEGVDNYRFLHLLVGRDQGRIEPLIERP